MRKGEARLHELGGTLYVVATPIGNLGDISQRALKVLAAVQGIAAEDTRRTRRLLQHFGISGKLWSYFEHNEQARTAQILDRLAAGEDIALVSDAGTPLISDPGYALVRAARAQGYRVVPIPGPNAALCALSAAGLPSDRFLFLGFPPRTGEKRRMWLRSIRREPGTLLFYESGQRLSATLADLRAILGEDRPAVLARELTKRFETFLSGSLAELCSQVQADPQQKKGEIVLLVGGHRGSSEKEEAHRVFQILARELPRKQAVALAAEITGAKKNRLYALALAQQQSPDPIS